MPTAGCLALLQTQNDWLTVHLQGLRPCQACLVDIVVCLLRLALL